MTSLGDARFWPAPITDSSDDALAKKGLDGIVRSQDEPAESQFGFASKEMVGRPISCIIPPDRADEQALILGWVGGKEEVVHLATERRRQDDGLAEVNAPWVVEPTRLSAPVDPGKHPTKAGVRPTGGNSRLRRDVQTHFSRIERHLLERPHTLHDQELLELGLFIVLGGRDARPVARALLTRYRTLGGVLASPAIELSTIRGLGKKGVAALKFVKASAVSLLRKEVSTAPVMSSWDQLMDYLSVSLKHERVEEFHVLFLNNRGALIADEVEGRGTVDRVPAYPREIVRRCLELSASGIIMVHNHPSGDPAPSRQDLVMTQEVERAVATMGILLHDHVIIGQFGCRSLRQEKLL